MINLETTITHTEKRMLTITEPSFWKEPAPYSDVYRAVLDENTFIEVWRLYGGDRVDIMNSTVKLAADKILEAQTKWTPVTEQEFMQNYDDAWESMRLTPKVNIRQVV